jgi:hypothetical protein
MIGGPSVRPLTILLARLDRLVCAGRPFEVVGAVVPSICSALKTLKYRKTGTRLVSPVYIPSFRIA